MSLSRIVDSRLLFLFIFVQCLSLRATDPTTTKNSVEKEVMKLDRAEAAAVLAQDVTALEKLWAKDFTVNAPNNKMKSGRAEILKMVRAGILDYSSFERTIEAVLSHGDTVIFMGEEVVKPKGNAPLSGQTVHRRFTNIWLKREGRWQLAARQATIFNNN